MHSTHHRVALALCATCMDLALAAALVSPLAACAGVPEWPLAAPADVLTAFGARYAGADGEPATHRGADLAAQSGDRVLAPCPGVVRFVGRVPAVGSSGSQLALTIERDDGLRLTLMPLASACVSVGARVAVGTKVAEVAGQGDESSTSVHLHVGARRGDLYVDPLEFLSNDAREAGTSVTDGSGTAEGSTRAASSATPATVKPDSTASSVAQPESAASGALAAHSNPAAANSTVRAAPAPETAAHFSGTTAEPTQARATSEAAREVGQQGAGRSGTTVVGEGSPAASGTRSSLESILASVANRSVPAASRSLTRLVRAWFVAAIALLAATGALWPLWRRTQSAEEPGLCVAPVGGEIAAAAGR